MNAATGIQSENYFFSEEMDGGIIGPCFSGTKVFYGTFLRTTHTNSRHSTSSYEIEAIWISGHDRVR